MNTDNLLHRHGEQAERIVVPEVAFGREWQLVEIVETANQFAVDSSFFHSRGVERHRPGNALNTCSQTLELKLSHFQRRYRFNRIADVRNEFALHGGGRIPKDLTNAQF